MGYKPLSSISFAELQSLLSNLTLITMDNEQVYSIDPTGFDFDSGTIKLQDPPPEYTLINAHMADTAIHGDHVALNALVNTFKRFALRGDGVHPIAATATPIAIGDGLDHFADNGAVCFICCFRPTSDVVSTGILFNIIDTTNDDNLLEFGWKNSSTLYLKFLGVEKLTQDTDDSPFWKQYPIVAGFVQDASAELTYFFINGQVFATQSNVGKRVVFTEPHTNHLRFGDGLAGELYWAGIHKTVIYPPSSYHTPPPLEGGLQYGRDWIAYWRFGAGTGNTIADINPDSYPNYGLTKDANATWVTI